MRIIETAQQLEDNISLLHEQPVLGLDCETEGLDPLQDRLRLIQIGPKEERLIIDVRKVGTEATAHHLKPFLESKEVVKILHNAKFDAKFIKHWLGVDVERIFDSYITSLLIEGGIVPKDENGKKIKGFHKLDAVVKRHLGEDMDKTLQTSDWSGDISVEQLKYADNDVEKLFPLRDVLVERLREEKLIRCAKLEFDAILPTAWMELNGFYLDFDEWMRVADEQKVKADEMEQLIFKELAPVVDQGSLFGECNINLGSHIQVQKYFRLLGIPMPSSTKEAFLTPLAKDWPIIEKFIEYKGFDKAYTAFGDKYKKFINPVSGRVHADFMQIGAGTGRYATAGPNLSQIPSDDAHRHCFKAEKGNKLIISDFSQEELRLLAEFSGDKAFRQAFKDGDDFHKATAANIFKIPITEVTKSNRDLAKRMNFLLTYGGGAKRFALVAEIPVEEAEKIMSAYFSTFKSVDRWLKYQQYQVLLSRQARSVSGRVAKYVFDSNNWGETSHAQRMAANMPMQASGADILKRALRLLYDSTKQYHPDVKLVNIVHDEIIVEAPEELVPEVTEKLESAMKQSWYESVKHVDIKVDTNVLDYWHKG